MEQQLLRPYFTQNIYKNIVQKSISINIFGEKGTGKSRFIRDLLTLLDNEIKVINIDIRPIRNNYDKFVTNVKEQLNSNAKTLSDILEKYSEAKTLFIIDNFEELYKENVDKRYDFDFFAELNAYKNKHFASLIILSNKNYTQLNFYNNNKLSTSPLDVEVMQISPLTTIEIENELSSHLSINIEYGKLANMIEPSEQPKQSCNF